jgi:hypothetical protein
MTTYLLDEFAARIDWAQEQITSCKSHFADFIRRSVGAIIANRYIYWLPRRFWEAMLSSSD